MFCIKLEITATVNEMATIMRDVLFPATARTGLTRQGLQLSFIGVALLLAACQLVAVTIVISPGSYLPAVVITST